MSVSDGGKKTSSNEDGRQMNKARTEKNDEDNVSVERFFYLLFYFSTHTQVSHGSGQVNSAQ